MYDIEKEKYEIPKSRNNSKYPFKHMEIGESFYVPLDGRNWKNVQRSIYGSSRSKRMKHKKFITRKMGDGIRCWRIA